MNHLGWKKVGDAYHLASPIEVLVKLQVGSAGKSLFRLQDETYEVRRSGFWNQLYTVYKDNKPVVSVSHQFWGSRGKIKFSDGVQYVSDYNYKNTLTLQFFDRETEILNYCVGGEHGNRQALIKLGIALVDAERLLILASLGMVMFLNIFNEFQEDDGGVFAMDSASF